MEPLTIGAAARTRAGRRGCSAISSRQGSSSPRGRRAATGCTGSPSSTGCGRCASCCERFGVEIGDVAFAARLRRDAALRAAVDGWLAGLELEALEWEQAKHERLLAA